MRMRRKPWARPELAACNYYVSDPSSKKGRWRECFTNSGNPLYLEIGCGKGVSTASLVFENRDKNFIAMDIKSDVLGSARRNIQAKFDNNNQKPENIMLFTLNAQMIDSVFDKNDSIDRIYINFCNPWPREKHKKRRLTYPTFLEKYKSFLSENGEIYFRTDDDALFEDSLAYFEESGYKIVEKSYDLHNCTLFDGIESEHEKMFSEMGIKIKFCIAKLA